MKKLLFIFLFLLPFVGLQADDLQKELAVAKQAARLAGQKVLHIYMQAKDEPVLADAVVQAHLKSGQIILEQLGENFSEDAFIGSNSLPFLGLQKWWEKSNIWFFEPLDGHLEFYNKGSRFCVAIGLVRNGIPVLGVYYFPFTETYYWATQGGGAYKQIGTGPVQKIALQPSSEPSSVFTNEKSLSSIRKLLPSLYGRVLSKVEEDKLISDVGSIGYRICRIAEGASDIYIANTYHGKLWHFAAGQVILQEVGGVISDHQGKPLFYRDSFARIHTGVLICNTPALQRQILLNLSQK